LEIFLNNTNTLIKKSTNYYYTSVPPEDKWLLLGLQTLKSWALLIAILLKELNTICEKFFSQKKPTLVS